MKKWIFLIITTHFPMCVAEEFWTDSWQDFHSPVSTEASVYFWSGTALTLGTMAFKRGTYAIRNDISEDRPLANWSKIGYIGGIVAPNLLYFSSMLAHSHLKQNKQSKKRATHMFKATAYSVLLTGVLKATVREPRPTKREERVSFPSGHSSSAFSFASVVAHQHEWYWATCAYIFASFVSFSRLNDDQHYIHDVFAGATIGISYGAGIYQRMLQEKKGIPVTSFIQLLPNKKLDGMSVVWIKDFDL